MSERIFDEQAHALRRQRAEKSGPRLFLAERAIEDIADRLSFVRRRFGRGLLIGCPDPQPAQPQPALAGTPAAPAPGIPPMVPAPAAAIPPVK